jgi:hypothetical protein
VSTFVVQTAAILAMVPFVAFAFLTARHLPPDPRAVRASWWMTAGCFGLITAIALVQTAGSLAALTGGRGSVAWDLYVAWIPAGNYARSLPIIPFAVLLLAVAIHPRNGGRYVGVTLGLCALFAVLGIGVGMLEGPYVSSVHLSRIALISGVSVILLLAALLVATATDSYDQLLWLILGMYALKEALSVSLLSLMAWREFSRLVPPAALFQMTLAAWLVMVALSARRYHHAVKKRPVPALFERVDNRRKRVLI